MVILWTDFIFWLLLLGAVVFTLMPKPRHLTDAWSFITASRLGMISWVILLIYALIAMLDCIHFKTQGSEEILSLLDLILSPLNQIVESSYSRPFQIKGLVYTKNISDPMGYFISSFFYATGISLLIALLARLALCHAKRRSTLVLTLAISSFILVFLFLLSRDFHVMGTDKIGQDVFYQTLKSIRTGFLIGTLTTLVIFPFALLFGTIAGYFQGWADDVIQYVYSTISSIPSILLIVAMMLMLDIFMGKYPALFENIALRADFRLLAICLIFGLTSWTSLCRVLRAETLKLREQDYVLAGRVLGTSHTQIILKHIIPNLMHLVMISLAMDFSALVLAESVLSYVGVGVDASTFSWGNMINAARFELARDPLVWWSLSAAFVFMFILVLAANLFADVLQKAFDPRSRNIQS